MDSRTLLGRKFHLGSRATRALSYKTIARFEFDAPREHQNENPAGEKELNVRHFQNGVFYAILK